MSDSPADDPPRRLFHQFDSEFGPELNKAWTALCALVRDEMAAPDTPGSARAPSCANCTSENEEERSPFPKDNTVPTA